MKSDIELKDDLLSIRLPEGTIGPTEALEIQQTVWKIFKKERRPLRVLIDVRQTRDADTRAKKILADTIREDSPMVIRTAVVYSDMVAKARTKIIYLMGQRRDMEFFTDVGVALAWLKG